MKKACSPYFKRKLTKWKKYLFQANKRQWHFKNVKISDPFFSGSSEYINDIFAALGNSPQKVMSIFPSFTLNT
jgi:hypothetical protein